MMSLNSRHQFKIDTMKHILTNPFVIVLLIVAIIALIVHFSLLISTKFKLKKKNLSNYTLLASLWKRYSDTFQDVEGNKKTKEYAEDFFNESEILPRVSWMRLVNYVPAFCVGGGILGTFIGLSNGISGMDLSTTEATQKGVKTLLDGAGMSFDSSIGGMGISIVFSLLVKGINTWFDKTAIIRFCKEMDKDYHISPITLEKEEKESTKQILVKILESAELQEKTLATLSDDLTEPLQEAMEKILEENTTQMSNLIEEKLVPVLNDLRDVKQESASKTIETTIENLASSMESMMTKFQDELVGQAEDDFKQLTETLISVSSSLNEFPLTVENLQSGMKESILQIQKQVDRTMLASSEHMVTQNQKVEEIFTNASKTYGDSISVIQEQMETLQLNQEKSVKESYMLSKEIESFLAKSKEVYHSFKEITENTENATSNLKKTFTKAEEREQLFKENTIKMSKLTNDIIEGNKEFFIAHKNSLDLSKDSVNNFATKFEVIDRGLKSIFQEIQNGLERYKQDTNAGVNDYLEAFTTKLGDSQGFLRSLVEDLKDISEELTSEVEKMNNKMMV